ncbi:MAG: cytochrome c3 family protein [Chitinophagales bacterium]
MRSQHRLPLHLITVVSTIIIACSMVAQASTIVGSLHDLSHAMQSPSMTFWNTYNDYNQVCVYCHTPHNASTQVTMLWNRSLPDPGSYPVYRSWTMISAPSAPGNSSLMCLSCHDGTIAVDSVIRMPMSRPGGRPNPGGWTNPAYPTEVPFHGKMAAASQSNNAFWDCGVSCHDASPIGAAADYSGHYLTQDLTDDHPVGVNYPDPTTYADRFEPVPARELWPNGVRLYSNKVECGSCHAVHDPGFRPFLRCSNDGSALCLTCHKK